MSKQTSRKKWQFVAAGALLLAGGAAQAALESRAGGLLVYDTVLDITWTANAGLSGPQTQPDLVQWAADLDYAGFDDWRLASASVSAGTPTGTASSPVDCSSASEVACRDNEIWYMDFYGGMSDPLITPSGTNIFWTGTYQSGNPANAYIYYDANNFGFFTVAASSTQYGWAVRDGDVDVPTVPLPGTAALLSLGLLGFGAARLRRQGALVSRSVG